MRKIRDLDKRRKARERRLAAMTPEERAAHSEWHATHRAGPSAAREVARRDREAAKQLQTAADRPLSEEAEAIQNALGQLKARRARLEARQTGNPPHTAKEQDDE